MLTPTHINKVAADLQDRACGPAEKRPEFHRLWRIRKQHPDGMFSCVEYTASRPVSAQTACKSPAVQKWLAGAPIDSVYHPD